jgi:hypothetical protein
MSAVVRLQIQTARVEPDIVVVHLNGRMTSRLNSPVVEPMVNDLLNQNERKLIFDLTAVEENRSSESTSLSVF